MGKVNGENECKHITLRYMNTYSVDIDGDSKSA